MANYPGQQHIIQFPSDPELNQEFVGNNGVTYVWAGDRWSSALGITLGLARFIIDGQYADSSMDNTLNGNGA